MMMRRETEMFYISDTLHYGLGKPLGRRICEVFEKPKVEDKRTADEVVADTFNSIGIKVVSE